ncbi:MAG: hypothetical protein ACM31C_17595 [Acidobacteriota bacterium]
MAQRRSRRAVESRSRGWWWLAVPLIGIAAYAAFDATLALIAPHDDTSQRVPQRPPSQAEAPRASSAPLAGEEPVATPLAAASAGDTASGGVASGGVVPDATPTAARIAADAAVEKTRAGRKRAAPQEHLTDRDRRALESVLDRAAEQQRGAAP